MTPRSGEAVRMRTRRPRSTPIPRPAFAGYRFPRRKAELTLGVLNLTDQDYRLNPLTLYDELPRGRTFMSQLRFSF